MWFSLFILSDSDRANVVLVCSFYQAVIEAAVELSSFRQTLMRERERKNKNQQSYNLEPTKGRENLPGARHLQLAMCFIEHSSECKLPQNKVHPGQYV